MARCNSTKPPAYRLHKAFGQAVVTINRKDRYLGKHGTSESRIAYERLISGWMESPEAHLPAEADPSALTVAELASLYLKWATTYYVKDGVATTERHNVKRAIKTLRETYASLPAKD